MESFGEILRKEREAKGVTISEICAITRINKRFITALEEDNYQILPAETFVKGFIRSYSKCVGIDGNEMVSFYKDSLKKNKLDNIDPIAEHPIPKSIGSNQYQKYFPLIIGAIASIIFIIILYIFLADKSVDKVNPSEKIDLEQKISEDNTFENSDKKETFIIPSTPIKKETEKKKNKKKIIQQPKPIKNITSSLSKKTIKTSETNLTARNIKPKIIMEKSNQNNSIEKKYSLQVTAREKSWINVEIDDDEIKDVILKADRRIVWKGNNKFVFSTGNIIGLEVLLNGNPVIFPSISGKVLKNFTIPGLEQAGSTFEQKPGSENSLLVPKNKTPKESVIE